MKPLGRVRASLSFAEMRDKRNLPLLGITCKRGCDSCCRYPKAISFSEAMVRVEQWITQGKQPTPNLREWATKAAHDLRLVPGIALLSKTPCYFLKDGLCSIYEYRPLLCRSHYATSDPSFCDPHRLGRGTELVPTPASDSLAPLLKRIGEREGLTYPTLPLSTAYYIAYRTLTCGWDVATINQEVRKLLLNPGEPSP